MCVCVCVYLGGKLVILRIFAALNYIYRERDRERDR